MLRFFVAYTTKISCQEAYRHILMFFHYRHVVVFSISDAYTIGLCGTGLAGGPGIIECGYPLA